MCYGPHFGCELKKERQKFLKSTHQFTCNCEPCRNNWPEKPKDFKTKVKYS